MITIPIIIAGIIFAILIATAIYDIRYQDVFLIAPLLIWVLALIDLLIQGGGLFDILVSSTSGLFLFVLGILLFFVGSTGFGDALLFWGLGFYIGNMDLAITYLGLTMICFIPFVVIYVFWFWYRKDYDITFNGFLRKIETRDLKEGMVLSQNKLWKGLTQQQIEDIVDQHGLNYKIWIKEGIPFSPAMLCGLICLFLTIQPF